MAGKDKYIKISILDKAKFNDFAFFILSNTQIILRNIFRYLFYKKWSIKLLAMPLDRHEKVINARKLRDWKTDKNHATTAT